MRKLLISLLLIFSLVGCSDSTPKYNKTISCSYEETEEDLTTFTELSANYYNSELVSGDIKIEMVYSTNSYARIAYNIYKKQQDEEHKVELILDENRVIMIVNYPSNNNADYFINQITILTLHGACSTENID